MKQLLIIAIATVLLAGCVATHPPESMPKKAPDISIHQAAGTGNIDAVSQHLAAGTNINLKDKSGWTPLHWAARKGHREIAELLIANGANVNAQDEDGGTPLFYVSKPEMADLLRKSGANE